jgi:hypothetical protein
MNGWIKDVRDILIVVWIMAPVLGLFTYRDLRRKKKADPFIRAVLTTIFFGTWLTLGLTFEHLSERGIIDEALKWFLIAGIWLLVIADGLLVRLVDKNRDAFDAGN